ncbi:MAG: purine-nucleoside phosphorylase [Trueperaceae bacterium]
MTDKILEQAVAFIQTHSAFKPDIAIVLGSGLGPLADEIKAEATLSYTDISGFAKSTAPGHEGKLVLGTLAGKNVVAMKGRVHYYEGHSAQQTAFPVQVMKHLGASTLLVSNACGSLNPNWQAGNLMLQLDLINFTGNNPLIGPNDDKAGPRFPVMFDCYDPNLSELARGVARAQNILLREGVYLAISGPAYATRAELRIFRALGADAIGMSTVYEVMVARHMGMRVLGLSTVTDMAIPDSHEHADEEAVLAMAAQSGGMFRALVKAILERM